MLKRIIRAFRHFLTLSKSEQRGIIALLILILLTLSAYYLLPFFIKTGNSDVTEFKKEIADFRQSQQNIHDSIRIINLQNSGELDRELAHQKLKPFPFDPNKLPEEAWAAIGLTERQIRSIKKYEANGGKFRRKEDLKKMYAISNVEYEILEPYIRIKSRFEPKEEKVIGNKGSSTYYSYVEINKADSAMLVKRLKIAPWLAARVIKYRDLLGGFYQKNQLMEVYGFDSVAVAKRSRVIRVNTSLIQKLDLNNSTFKQLLRHPYISYQLTQYIVNTRTSKGEFNSIEQIKESPLVSESLYLKLKPYITTGKEE
jgi:DNA uptake protein ComE-like DNA-binding protein